MKMSCHKNAQKSQKQQKSKNHSEMYAGMGTTTVCLINVIRGWDPCNPWLINAAGIEAVANPGLGENIAGTRGVRLNLLA